MTAAGYLCYLQAIHRIIYESHRLPWREKLLELPPEELVVVVLVVFVCIVFLKAYCIGIVWRCYKYLMLRQQHMRSLLPCVFPEMGVQAGVPGGPGFGAEERAYSTLLPNYDEAIAQYLKQAPPPSYQVAMSNYNNDDDGGAAGGGAQAGNGGGNSPLFVALDSMASNANTDDNMDNNNDVPNNNNTVHVNANTPPMRRSEQATTAGAADATGSDEDEDDDDADIEILDVAERILPPPPYNDMTDAHAQIPSLASINHQVNIPGQVLGRNESQA